ncbi:protein MEI2-like 6 [Camellia sinensis]|uniref:protein MEI2-like 6 n=1 Tax=Camellia sinensis TaxID=4442 RepID=UPI001035BA0E|nr:protein MEI2-like 6 [Camellia sinensis]
MAMVLSKPLNPKAQSWYPNPLYLARHVFQKPPPELLPPPAHWLPPPSHYMYFNFLPTYHHPISWYNLRSQPQPFSAQPPPSSPPTATASCGFGETGGKFMREKKRLDRGRPGLSYRGRVCRYGTSRPVWMPKESKSGKDVDACVYSSPHRRRPPPPPPPPPSSDDVSLSGRTTVMIKNIPYQYRRGDNLGYAFVNFTTAMAATKVQGLLQNHKWAIFEDSFGVVRQSNKICEISWARIQDLVKHFRNSNFVCSNLEYLPVVLSPPRDGTASLTSPTTIGRCLETVNRRPLKN